MKIVKLELKEELDFAGVDAIALVEDPAIELDFLAFRTIEEENFRSYGDYPKAAISAAKQGIKRNKAVNNKCGTLVGKQRAQQLANGENISLDTIKRMRSFLLRQKDNYILQKNRQNYDSCGYISYLLWGGAPALPWAEKKLRQEGELKASNEQIIMEEISAFNSETDIVDALIRDGVEEHQLQPAKAQFSVASEDKMRLAAPIMVADKLIPRIDENGDKYYVYFDADTIEQLAHKYQKQKLQDSVNLEHDPNDKVDSVTLVESWVTGKTDRSQDYGFNLPKGSWFGIFQIEDRELWDRVKAGEFKGVSVEGFFQSNLIKEFSQEFISVKPNESKDDYISRCMQSSILKKEFPNEKQRLAVCISDYDRKR